MRTVTIGLLVVLAIAVGLVIGLVRTDAPPDDGLTASEAAAALRSAETFTVREGSQARRELVEVVAVRRIGRTSIEVEFTWRDAGPRNAQTGDVRTSMALFRDRGGRQWVLTSLYKVD